MIYLTGQGSSAERRRMVELCPQIGMMHNSADGWRNPWCQHWALDNGVFARSPLGTRPDPDWWWREGETLWIKALEKATHTKPTPLFVVLPDVVMDWPNTLSRAWRYRCKVERAGLKPALALQNGFAWESVERFHPQALFVGGDRSFKWGRLSEIVAWARPRGVWVHVGCVNGWRAITMARQLGANSADGTGLARHPTAILPEVLRGLGYPPAGVQFSCFELPSPLPQNALTEL